MKTVGIICEYNPFHRGHGKQIRMIRESFGKDTAVVCLMSGNFVQRGAPAVFDKSLRAEAAVRSGADLVLELPVTYALSSAEGFAAGGVSILSRLCDTLCFGAETGKKEDLLRIARILLSEDFKGYLQRELETGKSFPAARQAALALMCDQAELLSKPNDILAVEYCKAIMMKNSGMEPYPIIRQGDYHDRLADQENPSATSLRELLAFGQDWLSFIPEPAQDVFRNAPVHSLQAGERAVLAILRTLPEEVFVSLPYGTEGLWRKFMRACRQKSTVEEIIQAVKSKRYTRTRLDRMLMCALLGLRQEDMEKQVPYIRILAFNDRGREILNRHKEQGFFRNAGEPVRDEWWEMEVRCGALYGLFSENGPENPDAEMKRRVTYLRSEI